MGTGGSFVGVPGAELPPLAVAPLSFEICLGGKTGFEGAADVTSGFEVADPVGDGMSGFISSVSSSSDQAFSDSLKGSNPSEMQKKTIFCLILEGHSLKRTVYID